MEVIIMINLKYNGKNKEVELVYNAKDSIKGIAKPFNLLKIEKAPNGIYTNLNKSKHISIVTRNKKNNNNNYNICNLKYLNLIKRGDYN